MRSILTINGGSSSLRFGLFSVRDGTLGRVLTGKFDRVGLPGTKLVSTEGAATKKEERRVDAADHLGCVPILVEMLEHKLGNSSLSAVGHRVVHGGPRYREPQRIDSSMIEELRRIGPFDPEHLPAEIALMEALQSQYPQAAHVACFDTAFHQNLPQIAKLLPIPRRYQARGVQRYGFHGLSYAYLLQELERIAGAATTHGRVILAHLGNGASMAAVRDGKSIDTTMAFTPSAGLMMSTRSGDIDPGLVAYLARTDGMRIEEFHRMINAQSGLLGVSEISSDIRDLLAQEVNDPRAAEAVALFCYQAKKWIGAFAAALGGLDTLVFAGGIGENSATIRERICDRLEFLGVELEPSRNDANTDVISSNTSKVTVRVIHTDEESYIAQSLLNLIIPH